MPILFGLTMFVSALLLFLIQPMVGKMILPLLGGTPAVWNSCMVFFQALLLAGYYYSHRTTLSFPTRTQVVIHAGVLGVAVAALLVAASMSDGSSPVPIVKSLAPQGSQFPFFGVIGLLAVAIGLPFFTISTTAPLLQKWFSETGHPSAKDPYFLYAASNFGSLLSLLLYPILIEPQLRLVQQAWLFAIGFIVLAVLIMLCARVVYAAPPKVKEDDTGTDTITDTHAPTIFQKLRWLMLAAVPSSMMLSVTTDVVTDIVSMPLLWIIPLALYLITFIIVFSKSVPPVVHVGCCLLTPVVILLVVFVKTAASTNYTQTNLPFKAQLLIQFFAFFLVTMTCHGELARTRPAPRYLTSFYLIMSIGGMVGGIFNALVAPVVFTFISEYPLSLIAACFVLPPLTDLGKDDKSDSLVSKLTKRPAAMPEGPSDNNWGWVNTTVVVCVAFVVGRFASKNYLDLYNVIHDGFTSIGLAVKHVATMSTIVAFGLPMLGCYAFVEKPLRLGLAVGCFWLGTYVTFARLDHFSDTDSKTFYTRSFFGTMKVERDKKRDSDDPADRLYEMNRLVHGTTLHGLQFREADNRSLLQTMSLLGANNGYDALALSWIAEPHTRAYGREPLTYYHRTGPVGMMFQVFDERNKQNKDANKDLACIGLGTGSLSCYGQPQQKQTFFEIDWSIRQIAENPKYFSYLTKAREQGTQLEFLMGDARLTLEQEKNRRWGFMLVDAFSSDAVPAHLLTKEAIQLYFDHVEEDSIVALHISNRYLDLEPVVERIVRELGYSALILNDRESNDASTAGKSGSSWVAVARKKEHLGSLNNNYYWGEQQVHLDPKVDAERRRWGQLRRSDKIGLWTDDYTPLLDVLMGDWDFLSWMK